MTFKHFLFCKLYPYSNLYLYKFKVAITNLPKDCNDYDEIKSYLINSEKKDLTTILEIYNQEYIHDKLNDEPDGIYDLKPY